MSFEKQLKKESCKNNIKNNKIFLWWRNNGYKINRIIFFPIWIFIYLSEKYKNKRYESIMFSEEYCKKCIDKMLPKFILHYNEDKYCILISDCNDFGYITFYDLCFNTYLKNHGCKKEIIFTNKFYNNVKEYIINKYQIDGYNKMIMSNYKEWNEAKDKFNWYDIPYSCDYCKGVVFYR